MHGNEISRSDTKEYIFHTPVEFTIGKSTSEIDKLIKLKEIYTTEFKKYDFDFTNFSLKLYAKKLLRSS